MYVRKEVGLNASKVLSTKIRTDLKFATCCSRVWPSSPSYFPWGDRSHPAMSSVLFPHWSASLPKFPPPSSLNRFQNCQHRSSSFLSSCRLFLHTLAYLTLYTHVDYSSLQRLSSGLFLYQLQALCSPHTKCSVGGFAFSSALLSHLASEPQLP